MGEAAVLEVSSVASRISRRTRVTITARVILIVVGLNEWVAWFRQLLTGRDDRSSRLPGSPSNVQGKISNRRSPVAAYP